MLIKLKYYFTNWIDGMKISRQHFINSENALIDELRDSRASSGAVYNYGLLGPEPNEKSSLECNVSFSQSRRYKISLTLCRAVTSGGCRIEIIPGTHPELVSDNDTYSEAGAYDNKVGSASSFLAIVSVDPFNRNAFGSPDAEEYPPRNPNASATCKLSLVQEETLNTSDMGAFHLPVARFRVKNDELVKDQNYIPPVAVISAHPGTKQIYNITGERFNKIQEFSTEIAQKVVATAQNTPLAQNVKKVCEANIWHVSSEFFLFRTAYHKQSPVYLANSIVKLANAVYVTINLLSEREKEEMLQYFSYWNEVTPGKFEELLTTVIDADYDHNNLYDFFQPLVNFLKVWSDLLEKLKDLKLIGQKNEKFDFGGRTMETPKTKEKGKFNIFD